MTRITCFIPARYGSSRLPGKPLLKINDKPIIQRTYEQACKSTLITDNYVVTDDERIRKVIEDIGGKVLMVTKECENGTERICHAISQLDNVPDIVVNVQGDEPYVNPRHIDMCIERYLSLVDELTHVKCSTLHFKITKTNELTSTSCGKLVLDKKEHIMYCSRNTIPWNKKNTVNENCAYYGHIGVFCFEPNYLLSEYVTENTTLQLEEDIEWLKILEHGYKISSVLVTDDVEIGVNTREDYDYLCSKYD